LYSFQIKRAFFKSPALAQALRRKSRHCRDGLRPSSSLIAESKSRPNCKWVDSDAAIWQNTYRHKLILVRLLEPNNFTGWKSHWSMRGMRHLRYGRCLDVEEYFYYLVILSRGREEGGLSVLLLEELCSAEWEVSSFCIFLYIANNILFSGALIFFFFSFHQYNIGM